MEVNAEFSSDFAINQRNDRKFVSLIMPWKLFHSYLASLNDEITKNKDIYERWSSSSEEEEAQRYRQFTQN